MSRFEFRSCDRMLFRHVVHYFNFGIGNNRTSYFLIFLNSVFEMSCGGEAVLCTFYDVLTTENDQGN